VQLLLPATYLITFYDKVIEKNMLTIKILGSGCTNCKRLEAIMQQLVKQMKVSAEIIKVTEYADIMAYNIMSTPGLVINEKVVSFGRLPAPNELKTFIENA